MNEKLKSDFSCLRLPALYLKETQRYDTNESSNTTYKFTNDTWQFPTIRGEKWVLIDLSASLNYSLYEQFISLYRIFLFVFGEQDLRNEIVIRLQPDEAAYVKLLVKKPGLELGVEVSEMELDYKTRYPGVVIPGEVSLKYQRDEGFDSISASLCEVFCHE